jgi:hypothetical protein
MKTLKEQIAPFFQRLGRLRRERRYYEACSVPWFVFDFDQSDVPAGTPFDQIKLPFGKMILVIKAEPNMIPLYLESGKDGLSGAAAFLSGNWICWHGFELTRASADLSLKFALETLQAVLTGVLAFSQALQDPGVHVAAVRPVNGMRTVQWTKAQEHHVLLHRTHPANRPAGDSSSKPVDYDEAAVIRRMAHRVRAHFRVLRAARFRHKRGQAVRVREQWRGPKEWVNKRSRQTYRWVDKATLET